MQVFVVAMEYRGETLILGTGARRIPVREHAYDMGTATLAGHSGPDMPRLGFPARQRGWNSRPQAARCPDCDAVVQRIVRDVICIAVTAATYRRRYPR